MNCIYTEIDKLFDRYNTFLVKNIEGIEKSTIKSLFHTFQVESNASDARDASDAQAHGAMKKDEKEKKKKKTAYQCFFQEKRKTISNEYPNKKFGEISKEISQLWKSMTKVEKDKFNPTNTNDDNTISKSQKINVKSNCFEHYFIEDDCSSNRIPMIDFDNNEATKTVDIIESTENTEEVDQFKMGEMDENDENEDIVEYIEVTEEVEDDDIEGQDDIENGAVTSRSLVNEREDNIDDDIDIMNDDESVDSLSFNFDD